jgi:hypothetical protein
MNDSTPEKKEQKKCKIVRMKPELKPSKDTLFFLRMFARAYTPVSFG